MQERQPFHLAVELACSAAAGPLLRCPPLAPLPRRHRLGGAAQHRLPGAQRNPKYSPTARLCFASTSLVSVRTVQSRPRIVLREHQAALSCRQPCSVSVQMTTWAADPRGWHAALEYIDLIFAPFLRTKKNTELFSICPDDHLGRRAARLARRPGVYRPHLRPDIRGGDGRQAAAGAEPEVSPSRHRKCPYALLACRRPSVVLQLAEPSCCTTNFLGRLREGS